MRRSILTVLGTAVLATGMIWAQDAPVQGNRQGHNPIARMATELNLTDTQQQQAREIFQGAREQSRPLAQQLRQYRQDLAAAVRSGAAADQIDALTAKMGPLMSQEAGIQAKAFQKFYATLTPEQQQKVGQHVERFLGGGMMRSRTAGPGHGHGNSEQ